MIEPKTNLSSKLINKNEEKFICKRFLTRFHNFLNEIQQSIGNNKQLKELIENSERLVKISNNLKEIETPFDEDDKENVPPCIKDKDFDDEFLHFLDQAYKDLQKIIGASKIENTEIPEKAKKLEDEIRILIEAKKKLEERNKHLEKSREKLVDQLDESLDNTDNLKRQLFLMEKNMSKLADTNLKIESEKKVIEEKLKEKIERCEIISKELKEIIKKNGAKNKEIFNLAAEKRELLEILNENDEDFQELINEKKNLQEKIKNIEKANGELRISHIYIEGKFKDVDENNKAITQENKELANKLQCTEQELKIQNQEVIKLQDKIETLNRQIEELINYKIQLENKLKLIENTLNQLNDEKEDILAEKKKEIQELQLNLQEIKEKLSKINSINEQLQAQNVTLDTKIQESEKINFQMRHERECLQIQIMHLEIEVEDLRKTIQIDREENSGIQNNELQNQLTELEEIYDKLKNEKENLITLLKEKDKQIQDLMQTLQDSNIEFSQLNNYLNTKMGILDETIKNMKVTKDAVNNNLDKENFEFLEARSTIQNSQEEIFKLKTTNAEIQEFLEKKIKELSANNRKLNNEKQILGDKLYESESKLDNMIQNLSDAKDQVDHWKSCSQELKGQLEDQVHGFEEKHAFVEKEREKLITKVELKQNEISTLMNNLNDARTEVSKLLVINHQLRNEFENKTRDSDTINNTFNCDRLEMISKFQEKQREIEQIESILKLSKEEVQKLHNVNQELVWDLEEKNNYMKDIYTDLTTQNQELFENINTKDQQLEEIKNKLQSTLSEIEKLKQLNFDLQVIIEENVTQIQETREKSNNEKEELKVNINQKEIENNNLKNDIVEALAELAIAKVLHEELESDFMKKITELEKENDENSIEKQELWKKLKNKDAEIKNMINKLEDLREEMDEIFDENKSLQIETNEKSLELKNAQIYFAEEKKELLKKVQNALCNVEALKKDLDEAQLINNQLRNQNNNLCNNYQTTLKKLEEENAELIIKNQDKEKELNEQKEKLIHEKNGIRETYEENCRDIEQKYEQRIIQLTNGKDVLMIEKQELEEKIQEYINESQKLTDSIRESSDEMYQLQIRENELKAKYEENIKTLKDTNLDLQQEKNKLLDKIVRNHQQQNELEQDLLDIKDENKELKVINEDLLSEIDYLEEKLHDSDLQFISEKNELLEEIWQIEKELDEVKAFVTESMKENEKVKAICNEVTSQKTFLEEKLEETQRLLNIEKENLMTELEKVQKENKELKTNIDDHVEQFTKLNLTHNELNQKYDDVNERLSLLEEAHNDLNENHCILTKKYNDSGVDKHELQLKLLYSQKNAQILNESTNELWAEKSKLAEEIAELSQKNRKNIIEKCLLKRMISGEQNNVKDLKQNVDQANNMIIDLGEDIKVLKTAKNIIEKDLNEIKEEKQKFESDKMHLQEIIQRNAKKINSMENDLINVRNKALHFEIKLTNVEKQKKELHSNQIQLENEKIELNTEKQLLLIELISKNEEIKILQNNVEESSENIQKKDLLIKNISSTSIKLQEKITVIENSHKVLNCQKEEVEKKLIRKDKEIDLIKIHLSELRNSMMGQSLVMQDIKSENIRLVEKIKKLEEVNDTLRDENENLKIKNSNLKNKIEDNEEQNDELVQLLSQVTNQKQKVEDKLKSNEIVNKSLVSETELLNIKLESKVEEEKVLQNKINELESKLAHIVNITNPEVKKMEYDSTIEIGSILNLFKAGYKLIKPTKQFENLKGIIGLIGLNDSGKTHILSKINGETGLFNQESTENLSFKLIKDSKYVFVDGIGIDGPLGLSDKNEIEKNATEFLMNSYIMETSNVLILVMNSGSKREEELLKQISQKYYRKTLIVIQNFKDTFSSENLKSKLNERTIKLFGLETKKVMYDFEPLLYLEQLCKGKKIFHVIMAKEGSEAGDVYNNMSLKAITYILNMTEKNEEIQLEPLKSFELFIKRHIKNYLLKENNQGVSDVQIEIDGDRLISKGDYKLKPYIFDSLGNLRESLLEPEMNTEYIILRKDENIVGHFNIPQLLEETIKLTVERLNAENHILTIEGNRFPDEIENDKSHVIIDTMSIYKHFKLVIPIKCNLAEMLTTEPEDMQIDYENGVLAVSIPIYKDTEFTFEMI